MTANLRVFLSHTTRDQRDHSLAKRLAAGLRERGAQVWIAPDDIPSGAEWQREIVAAVMGQCSHFLVILSAASVASPWVLEEIRLAQARRRIDTGFIVLPLVVGETSTYPGSEFLEQFQKIPFYPDFPEQFEAVARTLSVQVVTLSRREFDNDVSELFSFFGYQIKPAAKHHADDTVFYAVSPRRNRSNLLVECAFRDAYGKRVSTPDVQRFTNVVSTERMNGTVDQGYLVTNLEFTPEARACLADQPQSRYLFIVSYDELVQSLLDSHNYLDDFVSDYVAKRRLQSFVDLRAIDTCGFPATSFEAIPGDQLQPSSASWIDFKIDGVLGIVMPDSEVARLIREGFAYRHDETGIIALEHDRVSGMASEQWEMAVERERRVAAARDYGFVESLLARAAIAISPERLRAARSTAENSLEARRLFTDIWEAATLKTLDCVSLVVLTNIPDDLVYIDKYDSDLFGGTEIYWETLRRVFGRIFEPRSHEYEESDAGERSAGARARFRDELAPLLEATWQSVLTGPPPRSADEVPGGLHERFEDTLENLRLSLHVSTPTLGEIFAQSPEALNELNKGSNWTKLWSHILVALPTFLGKMLEKHVELVSTSEGEGLRTCVRQLTLAAWKVVTTDVFCEIAKHESQFVGMHLVALKGLAAELPHSDLLGLGFRSSKELLTDASIDPALFSARIVGASRALLMNTDQLDPRRPRWQRDLNRRLAREYIRASGSERQDCVSVVRVQNPLGPYGPLLLDLVAPRSDRPESREVRLLPEKVALDVLQDFVDAARGNLLVVFGDFGAGKTTVTNRLMYDLARKKLETPYDSTVRLPLLINLREYNKVPDFNQLLRTFLTDQAEMGDINMRLFKRLNDAGQFVLLLDGFDEMLAQVTKPDRRRCFLEIAEYIGPKSKVILTGRPGYFPDHAEFTDVLEAMDRRKGDLRGKRGLEVRLICLQLMNDEELDAFVRIKVPKALQAVQLLFSKRPNLRDLARRPVLAGIIVESAAELAKLGESNVSTRRLYELYTDRWVSIEEDKGRFRILIDSEKKSTFLRYLAMQMHLLGTLSIHFRRLDQRIAAHFGLDSSDIIDHYGHDVRTCSFLNRTDDGEYRFIHKSFMEYFVACEFERMDDSPFADEFNKPLTAEMQDFVDESKMGLDFKIPIYRQHSLLFKDCIERFNQDKEEAVANQDFETAARLRYAADIVKALNVRSDIAITTMRRDKLKSELTSKVQEALGKVFKQIGSDESQKRVIRVVADQFPDLAEDLMAELAAAAQDHTALARKRKDTDPPDSGNSGRGIGTPGNLVVAGGVIHQPQRHPGKIHGLLKQAYRAIQLQLRRFLRDRAASG
jgi:hypothetical protein